jgi:hypothetical protein
MSWRDWAAAQYNRVLSIMRDTMDKTLFVRRRDIMAVWESIRDASIY